jgi:hypothetical protein
MFAYWASVVGFVTARAITVALVLAMALAIRRHRRASIGR